MAIKKGLIFKAITMMRIAGKYQQVEGNWKIVRQFPSGGSWICQSISNHLIQRWFTQEEVNTALEFKANGSNEILTVI